MTTPALDALREQTIDRLQRLVGRAEAAERERLAMAAESRTDGWCSLTAEEIRARGESDAP